MDPKNGYAYTVGFFYGGGVQGDGVNCGTRRIPKKDWGTLGNIGED